MRYFIYGYYGFGNFGDDLMLSSIVDQLRRKDPAAAFTVKCRDDVEGLGAGVTFLQADRILERPLPVWRRAWDYMSALWRGLGGHDRLVIGGGALFLDKGGFNKSLVFLWLLTLRAKLAGIPIHIVGVSFDLMANPVSLWLTRAIFRRARSISVRDSYSLDYARYFGRADAQLCADLAFASPQMAAPPARDVAASGRRRIGICLVDYYAVYEPDQAARRAFLMRCAAILRAHAGEADYVYLSLQSGQGLHDERLCDDLAGEIAFAERAMLQSAAQAMAALGRLDGIVTMRYHLGLLAQAAGLPVVALSHELKMASLADAPGVLAVPLARLMADDSCDPVAALQALPARSGDVAGDWAALRRASEANFFWA